MSAFREIEAALGEGGARGRFAANVPLAPLTWLRVGGAAEAFFSPANEADLSSVLGRLSPDVTVSVLGVGSNVLVRDAGIKGVVIRLGRGFSGVEILPGNRILVGAAVPDRVLANKAAQAGIKGLEFAATIPGTVGGGLRMNAGAYGGEFKDCVTEVYGIDRAGMRRTFSAEDMGFSYRGCALDKDVIFTGALLYGDPGDPAEIGDRIAALTARRRETQPLREKTGGSTFKNPTEPSARAWKLIADAGCRGLRNGGAQISKKHCNFMINTGSASAQDLEELGEIVRARVLAQSGVRLDWELRRFGSAANG